MFKRISIIHVFFILSAVLTQSAIAHDASWTTGIAKTINKGLITCGGRSRTSAVGQIESEDGKIWTVPADTVYTSAPKATDLYNECANITTGSITDVDPDTVSVVETGGAEVFTAYLFGDNYFELYINGTLIGVDSVPFTPFNSSVVKFSAERPFTVAVKMVDWEETLGLGVEAGRGASYHPGDGGLVAQIKDVNQNTIAITDGTWRAQTYYIAPITDRRCLVLDGNVRDSTACSTSAFDDPSVTSAAHWKIPEQWAQPDFDDTGWPQATTFTNDTVGVKNKKSYTNFTDIFDAPDADAQFIWSSNLILDNLVLLRKTVE